MGTRTYNTKLVRATLSYTTQEIARLFEIHEKVPLRWLKEGLKADRSRRPFLIRGDELIRFLSERRARRRAQCTATQFYCFKCRCPREAYLGIADVEIETATRVRVKSICAVCSTPVNKAQALRDLPNIRQRFEIQQLAGEHLLERAGASVNVDLEMPNEDTR